MTADLTTQTQPAPKPEQLWRDLGHDENPKEGDRGVLITAEHRGKYVIGGSAGGTHRDEQGNIISESGPPKASLWQRPVAPGQCDSGPAFWERALREMMAAANSDKVRVLAKSALSHLSSESTPATESAPGQCGCAGLREAIAAWRSIQFTAPSDTQRGAVPVSVSIPKSDFDKLDKILCILEAQPCTCAGKSAEEIRADVLLEIARDRTATGTTSKIEQIALERLDEGHQEQLKMRAEMEHMNNLWEKLHELLGTRLDADWDNAPLNCLRQCFSSVTEACMTFTNVGSFVDKIQQERDEARRKLEDSLVYEFDLDEVPKFQQGGTQHEMAEIVTAERCEQLVEKIQEARRKLTGVKLMAEKWEKETQRLGRKLVDLEGWKREQLQVAADTRYHEIAKEIGVPLGHNIASAIYPAIIELKRKLAEAEKEWKQRYYWLRG